MDKNEAYATMVELGETLEHAGQLFKKLGKAFPDIFLVKIEMGEVIENISNEIYDGAMHRIQSQRDTEQLQTTSQENETQD